VASSTSVATEAILQATSSPEVVDGQGHAPMDWVSIVSVIVNAIFDDDGPVDLSDQSLAEIRQIVREENFNQDRGYYIAGLRSFRQQMDAYQISVRHGYQPESAVQSLFEQVTDLRNDAIYSNPNYGDFQWRLTSDFGLIAAYQIAVAQENALINDRRSAVASYVASRAADDFAELGGEVSEKVNEQVRITQWANWNECGGQVQGDPRFMIANGAVTSTSDPCRYVVRDFKEGRSASFDVRHYGAQGAANKAMSKLAEWRSEHRGRWAGERYESNLHKMQTFQPLTRDDVIGEDLY